MEFKDLVQQRRSAHNFEGGFKVSTDQWETLLEYVRYTPSGYNAQPWRFKLIQDKTQLSDLYELCYKQDHIKDCGNLVVVIGDVKFGQHEADRIVQEWEDFRGFDSKQSDALRASLVKERAEWKQREMVIRNCSLAAMTMLYAAEDMGLASCPMMGFRQLDLKRSLGLAEFEFPIMLIALGKSAGDEPERLPRKSINDIQH